MAYLFIVIALLRAFLIFTLPNDPDFGDMLFYQKLALKLPLPIGEGYYGLPGYAFIIKYLQAFLGVKGMLLLNLAADLGTCWVILKLLKDCKKWQQLIGVGLWGFLAPSVFYGSVNMPTSLYIFALWFAILKKDKVWVGLWIGVWANVVATIFAILPWILIVAWKQKRKNAFYVLIGVILGILPCWLHNINSNESYIMTGHSGINFFLGNNAEATGYPKIPSYLQSSQEGLLLDSIRIPKENGAKSLTEVSNYWNNLGKTWINEHFFDYCKLKVTTFCNLFALLPYDDLGVYYLYSTYIWLIPFGVLVPLGLYGLFLKKSEFVPIVLLSLAIISVFVTERYRLCLAPGLCIGFAYSLTHLKGKKSLFLIPLVYLPFIISDSPETKSLKAYNLGIYFLNHEDNETAKSYFTEAAKVGSNAEISFALGNIAFSEGKLKDATHHYYNTVLLKPRHVSGWNNLGITWFMLKDFDKARKCLSKSLQIDPTNKKATDMLEKISQAADQNHLNNEN